MQRREAGFYLIFLALCLPLLFSCAAQMYTLQMEPVRRSLLTQDKSKIGWLEGKVYNQRGEIRDDVDVIYLLELGSIYSFYNNFKESNNLLEAAFKRYTEREERAKISARSVGSSAIDILFGEGSDEYELAQYEKVYLHTIKILNYLMLGKIESARVEAKRAIERHKLIKEYAEFKAAQVEKGKKDKYLEQYTEFKAAQIEKGEKKKNVANFDLRLKELTDKATLPNNLKRELKNVRNAYENSFTYLLAALTFGLNKEFNYIGPQLRNARALTDNSYVGDMLSAYNKNSRFMVSSPNIYIFAQVGFAPTKKNLSMPFVNPVSGTVSQISIAQIHPSETNIGTIELVDSTSQVVGRLERLTNLDLLALKQYDEDLPKNIAKAALRLIVQTIRDKTVMKEVKQEGAGFLTKIVLSALNVAVERADIRAWTLAPKWVWFYCGKIGNPKLTLRIKDRSGVTIGQKSITIDPDQINVVTLRCFKNVSLVQYQSFGRTYSGKKICVVWSWVNVRCGPSTNFKIIGKVHYGDSLKVVGKEGNWYCVELPDGREGYIFKDAIRQE